MAHAQTRPKPSNTLVLFDIDGTLTRGTGPYHINSLINAVGAVTGFKTTSDGIPVHGMLDTDIVTLMLRAAGASDAIIHGSRHEICARAGSFYVRACPDFQKKVLPGVRRVLWRLKQRRIPIGLVTGNLERIGWKKLERAGIKHYFWYGSFAGTAENRTDLARLAIEQALRQGWIAPGAKVSLIGDSPNDVIAAKSNVIQSIAVNTGISTAEELLALQPDVLVKNLLWLDFKVLLAA